MACTFYAQCLRDLRDTLGDTETVEGMDGEPYQSTYLGSYMALDPCGRYHHCISPNGVTGRCEAFWKALERAASRLGGWIEGGEGDPTDIFFNLPAIPAVEDEEAPDDCLV